MKNDTEQTATYDVRIVDGDGSCWGGQWYYPDGTVDADTPDEALDDVELFVQAEAAGLDDYESGDPITIYVYDDEGYTYSRTVLVD